MPESEAAARQNAKVQVRTSVQHHVKNAAVLGEHRARWLAPTGPCLALNGFLQLVTTLCVQRMSRACTCKYTCRIQQLAGNKDRGMIAAEAISTGALVAEYIGTQSLLQR
jgi:hypothetical protein